jgi:hypothetical protein
MSRVNDDTCSGSESVYNLWCLTAVHGRDYPLRNLASKEADGVNADRDRYCEREREGHLDAKSLCIHCWKY